MAVVLAILGISILLEDRWPFGEKPQDSATTAKIATQPQSNPQSDASTPPRPECRKNNAHGAMPVGVVFRHFWTDSQRQK